MRYAITGPPNSGKTALAGAMAKEASATVLHTDDNSHLGWSESSLASSLWFNVGGAFIVEGVAVPRALRKWLKANPLGRPVEELIVLTRPFVALSSGQERMAKGIETVLREILPELEARGVTIDRR